MKSSLRFVLVVSALITAMLNNSLAQQSVARQWSETQLSCIRKYFAKPTVHARNLSHVSIAMYDAWAAYDDQARPYLLGQNWGNFNCPFNGIPMPAEGDVQAAQEKAISYAAYRTLWNRYTIFAPGANLPTIKGYLNERMFSLGYDTSIVSIDYSDGDPAKLGNYIAAKLQEFALQDGSNQQNNYANLQYAPINGQLEPAFPGNPDVVDPNRWQSLVLGTCIDQNGIPVECPPGSGTPALSHEWGKVIPFALTEDQADTLERDGLNWKVYLDPGPPPLLDTTVQTGLDESFFKWGYVTNIIWHSFHNNDDGVMIDASPNSIGGLNITSADSLPATFEDYRAFYNVLEGGVNDPGHAINPATGAPYEPQMVPRKDFTRVLSQYWADGPSSETPPGHWFKLFNEVEDKMDLLGIQKRWMGEETVSDLEWDIKGYFALGGGIHDAAIACWGTKGYYDYTRPIMAIRWMGSKGQSTDPNLPHYHPAGLPLIPGYIELVEAGDSLAGANNEHVNKIKIYSWKGPFAATGQDGAGWLLAENWWTYQTAGFVTPPFAGYYSGHSTYSRTAAEIMTLITGDEYFPGGMAEYTATQDEYLLADDGPSTTVKLQWATYRDASDQCSVSRIYGGLHPPQDDIPGRKVGLVVGPQAVSKANEFIHANPAHASIEASNAIISDIHTDTPWIVSVTYDQAMNQTIDPALVVLNAAAEASLTFSGGAWTDAFTYTATFNVIDNNATINNIRISAQGAQNSNGQVSAPGVSAPFSIDTQNPTATAIVVTGAESILNDGATSSGSSVDVTISFSEPMNTSVSPAISFSAAEATASLILNASSSWINDTTFHATYDFVDLDVETGAVDIAIASASDAVGNSQIAASASGVLTIDTDAPSAIISASESAISDYSVGNLLTITVSYDSPMNTAIQPIITTTGTSLENTFTFGGGTWDAGGMVYMANFVILDGNVEATGVEFVSGGAQDVAGNDEIASSSSTLISVDTKNPQVIEVSPSNLVLADAQAGLPFELAITFNEPMNGEVPTLTFVQSVPSLVQDEAASAWQGNTYVAVFNFTDDNVEVSNVTLGISGGADAAGNPHNGVFNANNPFTIDTHNPLLSSINPSTATINNGDTGTATFAITLNFDEAMDITTTPFIAFSPEVPCLTLSNTSAWDSEFTYTAHYDVAEVETSITGIGLTIEADATDIAGNLMVTATSENLFDVDIVNVISNSSQEQTWVAYPNPIVSGTDLRLAMPSDVNSANVILFDAVGKLISSWNYTGNNSPMLINTAHLSEGVYLIRIHSENKQGSLTVHVIR